MPEVRFTANIQRHVACPVKDCSGGTARQVLDAYFNEIPDARGYVLDEQAALRPHVVVFINGRPLTDRTGLSDTLAPTDTIDVMQALSGG